MIKYPVCSFVRYDIPVLMYTFMVCDELDLLLAVPALMEWKRQYMLCFSLSRLSLEILSYMTRCYT